MNRFAWSRQAINDLERIAEFVREFDPRKEQQVTDLLILSADQLRTQPHSGQRQSILPDGSEIRLLLVGKLYRLRYLITVDKDVTILQIIDLRSGQPR